MADPRFSREQVEFNPDRVGMRPSAPTASLNFVPPPRSTGFDDAMKALSSLEPAIDGFLEKKQKELSDKDLKAGREAAMKEALEYGEAVRQGKLAPNQSKWFMKGYKAQYGELLGQQWAQEAKSAWEGSDAKNSDKPDAANGFITDFIKGKLNSAAGLDPDVREGLLPQMTHMRGSIMAAQSAYSAEQVKQRNLEVAGGLISGDIDKYANGQMTLDQLMVSIKDRDKFAKVQGVNPDDFNKMIVESFTAKAREKGDRRLLDAVKSYQYVGNNPKYQNALRSADDAILSRQASQESLAWTRYQRQMHEQSRMGVINVYAALGKMQDAGMTPEVTPEMRKYLEGTGDPEAVTKATSYAKTLREGQQEDRPMDVNDAYKRIFMSGPNAPQELDAMILGKQIKSKDNIVALHSLVRSVSQITNDDFFNKPAERIRVLALQGEFGKPGIDTNAVADAVDGYQREYAKWRMANPQATEMDRMAISQKLEQAFMTHLDQFKMVKTGNYQGGAGDLQGRPSKDIVDERKKLIEDLNKGKK
jgi:hypothetical protein